MRESEPKKPPSSSFDSSKTSGLSTTARPLQSAVVTPVTNASIPISNGTATSSNWREATDDLRRVRARIVLQIDRMLRNHQPHGVLTEVDENADWRSRTKFVALKIERLMFMAARSRESYMSEDTLPNRVQMLSRYLVQVRKHKNSLANAFKV